MLIKVCGLNNYENFDAVKRLQPDFMGLIFYPQSPRYVFNGNETELIKKSSAPKIGVFVNEKADVVKSLAAEFNLTGLQFHGNESVEYMQEFKTDYLIIKALKIKEENDLTLIPEYPDHVSYLLLDTYTEQHGGSGIKFNWQWLNHYQSKTPFILSGGIDYNDAAIIKEIEQNNKQFRGVDLNSKFELTPGIKDLNKLKHFITCIR